MKFEQLSIEDILACDCPEGGDASHDCENCVYSPEYHLVDGECVRRSEDPVEQILGPPTEVSR